MFNPEKVMFKLDKDFNDNGVPLKAGVYSYAELIKLYGSEQTLNYCFTCTSLRDALVEIKQEEKMDKRIIENKAILDKFENKEMEITEEESVTTEEPELTLEELKKIADDKGIEYHHRAGIEKLKSLIKESE